MALRGKFTFFSAWNAATASKNQRIYAKSGNVLPAFLMKTCFANLKISSWETVPLGCKIFFEHGRDGDAIIL